MKCLTCGEDTRVLETRGTKRRRVCPNDHVFWTDELVISDVTIHGDRAARAAKLRAKVAPLKNEKAEVIAEALGINPGTARSMKHRLKGTTDGCTPEKAA